MKIDDNKILSKHEKWSTTGIVKCFIWIEIFARDMIKIIYTQLCFIIRTTCIHNWWLFVLFSDSFKITNRFLCGSGLLCNIFHKNLTRKSCDWEEKLNFLGLNVLWNAFSPFQRFCSQMMALKRAVIVFASKLLFT